MVSGIGTVDLLGAVVVRWASALTHPVDAQSDLYNQCHVFLKSFLGNELDHTAFVLKF